MIRILGRRTACAASVALTAVAVLGSSQALAKGIPSFQTFYEYTIAFRGEGSYTRTTTNTESGGVLSTDAKWSWNSAYPHVLIPTTGSNSLFAAGFPAYGLGQEGKGDWKITNTGSVGEDCSNSGTLGLKASPTGAGGGSVKVHRPGVGLSKGVIFNLVALEGYETTSGAGNNVLPCDPTDFWQEIIEGFVSPGIKHTNPDLPEVKPLSTTIKLAPSDLKHATVTKHVSIGPAEMVSSDCGSGAGIVCQQDYTWSGVVRFTKHKFKG